MSSLRSRRTDSSPWRVVGGARRPRGAIELELGLRYDGAFDYFSEEDLFPEHLPNLLRVAVTRGRGLLAMDRCNPLAKATSSDARARLSVACRAFSTKVVPKSLAPAWHERFECHVEGDGHVLKVVVEDVDQMSAPDFMVFFTMTRWRRLVLRDWVTFSPTRYALGTYRIAKSVNVCARESVW